GGFADVHKGSLTNGPPVALKVLRIFVPDTAKSQMVKDFCREALIWRQLIHPNILPFMGISRTAFHDQLCMVAPWMQSGTITDYLEKHPTSDRKALVSLHFSSYQFLLTNLTLVLLANPNRFWTRISPRA
ncbi:hypothetical protein DL96DRAFT_1488202, partial [Flagelloscypha sp. PMI_526]